MTDAKTLYDWDFVAWSEQQAEALRAAATARIGTNQALDWENLAEEIEDLGRSVRRELRSQLTRIVHHLLKLQYSPATDPRRSWRNSIREARSEVARLLNENPSLRREVARLAGEQRVEAAKLATADLEDYGELDSTAHARLVATAYTPDQILGDWFPPPPAHSSSSSG
jgi:hypothetical protein